MTVFEKNGIILGLLLLAATAAGANPGLRLTVADAVLGILNYSRWPGVLRPLRLCSTTDNPHVAALKPLHELAPAGRLLPLRLIAPEADPGPDCDAVFFGPSPAVEARLPELIGRPVLTIGESTSFCSRGGMFCLVPRSGGDGLRIEVNLDTVARSGLRVHPQVLKLGQPRSGVGEP